MKIHSCAEAPAGVVVSRVRPGSAAAAAGVCGGDRLLAVNGAPLRDVIDFQFNAGEEELRVELDRIETQRLSPLYVSVHATDPALRHELLGRPRVATPILPVMARLARAGISMHAQIVLCPGLNDGAQLARTVFDLSALHPGVRTAAIVPVGLTRHRQRLPELRSLEPGEARALAATVTAWQAELRARLGSRFVFLADEIY